MDHLIVLDRARHRGQLAAALTLCRSLSSRSLAEAAAVITAPAGQGDVPVARPEVPEPSVSARSSA